IACMATRLMSSGAAKSGKPCERLTAPYFMASRVISRITDSVKRLAFRETRLVIEVAGIVIREFGCRFTARERLFHNATGVYLHPEGLSESSRGSSEAETPGSLS